MFDSCLRQLLNISMQAVKDTNLTLLKFTEGVRKSQNRTTALIIRNPQTAEFGVFGSPFRV